MSNYPYGSGKRRKKKQQNIQVVLGVIIAVLLLALIGVLLYFVLGSRGCGGPKVPEVITTDSGDSTAETDENGETKPEDIPTSHSEVLAYAKRQAAMYDYEGAVTYVKIMVPDYESDQALKAFVGECNATKEKLVKWADNTQITHIFFHTLVADNDAAWSSYKVNDYNEVMTTIPEFNKIMQTMYDEGYVLVHLSDIAKIVPDANGENHMTYQPIYLPKGKVPFVLSVDDVSYYEYMNNTGFANKLVIDEDGRVVNEKYTYKQSNSSANGAVPQIVIENGAPVIESTERGDFDVVPLLDKFVEEHPDFSYHGAKGTIALTGYNGVLGYKTSEIAYGAGDPNWPSAYEYHVADIEKEREEAKKVADAMKANGWKFASHTWGHMNMSQVVDQNTGAINGDRFTRDTTWWMNEVSPIIGPTDIIIFAFGADIGSWRGYSNENQAFMYLKNLGFNYFCNVDSSKHSWVQLSKDAGGSGYLRQGRRNLDGQLMFKSLVYPEKGILSDLFDAKQVFDRSRPLPVPGVTIPEGFDINSIFN